MNPIFLPNIAYTSLGTLISQQNPAFSMISPENMISFYNFKMLAFSFQQAFWRARELYDLQIAQALHSQTLNYNKITTFSDHNDSKLISPPSKVEILKFEQTTEEIEKESKNEREKDFQPHLNDQITEMVNFFIEEYGKVSQSFIDQERAKYANSPALTELFDSLQNKFLAARKCREDMIRLSLRKALTWLRDSLRDQLNISARAASVELCKRYFGAKQEDLLKEEDDGSEDGENMPFLLPYKKNSKYSTPSMCFIQEIFASKAFHQDYVKYLSQLDEILEADNNKKIPKFIDFLVGCVKQNMICKVKNYKRLPWLKVWLSATKVVANELMDASSWKDIPKERLQGSKKRKQKSTRVKVEKIS